MPASSAKSSASSMGFRSRSRRSPIFLDAAVAEETGSSFAENARQKALHYAGITGMVTMAEDSGFEVDALNGEPGIYSARYLREDATYDERFAAYLSASARKRLQRSLGAICVRARGGAPRRRAVRNNREGGRIARGGNLPGRTASATTRFSGIRTTAGRSAKCQTTRKQPSATAARRCARFATISAPTHSHLTHPMHLH